MGGMSSPPFSLIIARVLVFLVDSLQKSLKTQTNPRVFAMYQPKNQNPRDEREWEAGHASHSCCGLWFLWFFLVFSMVSTTFRGRCFGFFSFVWFSNESHRIPETLARSLDSEMQQSSQKYDPILLFKCYSKSLIRESLARSLDLEIQ